MHVGLWAHSDAFPHSPKPCKIVLLHINIYCKKRHSASSVQS